MNRTLIKHISELTNEELMDMLVSKSDYVPEAVNYAKVELERRQIGKNDLDTLFQERQLILDEKIHRAKKELSLREKLVCLLFPPVYIVLMKISPLLRFILPQGRNMIAYREEGYLTKASQALLYSLAGIILWFLFLILVFSL
jgi:hypothetical protein